MLPVPTRTTSLEEIADDSRYTEADRELIAAELERIADGRAQLEGGGARMGASEMDRDRPRLLSSPITITFEIAPASVYPERMWLASG